MSLPNIYHHRRVAESSAKPCFICFKPASSVLITPDSKDFFYICPGHLKDRGFAQPLDSPSDEDARKKLQDEELQKEIELVKKEYEEKMKARKEKKTKKDKDKDKEKSKKDKKDKDGPVDDDKAVEQEKDDKIKELEKKKSESTSTSDEPRIFALQKSVYQMRVNRIRSAQMAKQTQERLKDPSLFPKVPSGFS